MPNDPWSSGNQPSPAIVPAGTGPVVQPSPTTVNGGSGQATTIPGAPAPIPGQNTPGAEPSAVMGQTVVFDDIQGDILIGLQKRAQAFFFFEIDDVPGFKLKFGQQILRHVTSMAQAHERESFLDHLREDESDDLSVDLAGLNVGFTSVGLQKIGFSDPLENSFSASLTEIARLCGDGTTASPLASSAPDFPTDNARLDGVILLTGRDTDAALSFKARVVDLLSTTVKDAWPTAPVGQVRPAAMKGHEHFGWKDGVSQPVITELTTAAPPTAAVAAAEFVIGAGSASIPSPAWAANGSYMVYRCLEQDVAGFADAVAAMAAQHSYNAEELGARIMGRWKSGAPLVAGTHVDNPAIGADDTKNNAFDFASDPGAGCPMGSHIRKTNPRQQGVPRIMRRGIPFGREIAEDPNGHRGLNFVCYQASLSGQFEFIQQSWANSSSFQGGIDPVIGRDPNNLAQNFTDNMTGTETKVMPLSGNFVTGRAAAYFFMPSMSTLALIPWRP